MNFAESPEEKIKIELSGKQWELLQKTRPRMDEELGRCVSVAVKRNNVYELYLTEEEVDDLIDHLEGQAEDAPSQRQQDAFYELADFFLDFTGQQEDDLLPGAPPVKNLSKMTGSVYVFRVELVDDTKIWRRIALRGGQTLHDLHNAIFDAFDREEEHLYSFYIPPTEVKSKSVRKFTDFPEFTHPYALEDGLTMMLGMFARAEPPQDAARTAIQTLGLSQKHRFLYLFDFGDEWLHWITVEQTDGKADDNSYPRILDRHGESPAQYGDDGWDEEDDWDDEDL